MSPTSRLLTVAFVGLCLAAAAHTAPIIADHTTPAAFDDLTYEQIDEIRAYFQCYYAHTSHGSQIVTGLDMIEYYDANIIPITFHEVSDDLGHNGDTSWVPATRTYLDANPEYNLVMFSWCGGCSDNTEEGINTYLAKMEELEAAYSERIFIYMTGHLDGTGVDGNLYARNNQIRQYCIANDRVLFDFADIESYDPDGIYYPDGSDVCEWCYDWCDTNWCAVCSGCAHSHCQNCYLKGKAFWWLLSELMPSGDTCYAAGDVNDDGISLSQADFEYLVAYLDGSGPTPPEPYQADLNGDGYIDHLDAVVYNDYFENGLIAFEEYPVPTVCEPDTFFGACCGVDLPLVESGCAALSAYNCHELEGGYGGYGSSCQATECDTVDIGACCDSALNCTIKSRWECEYFGNDFTGDGVTCDPYPCLTYCCELRADINNDGVGPDVADLVYLVTYMFQEGPEPPCLGNCDINGDLTIADIADLVYLTSYMFQPPSPAPIPCP